MVDRRERVHDDAPLVQFGPDLGEGDVRLRLDQRPHHIGVRFENRWPPMRAGAMLPVSRTRRISLTAAEGLTSYRAAARRIELPPSTARTIRRRRS